MAQYSLAERHIYDFFCKFSKVYLFDLKPNCAHPYQESIEMVCLWLFVTWPFFRDEWRTVNSSCVIYMIAMSIFSTFCELNDKSMSLLITYL